MKIGIVGFGVVGKAAYSTFSDKYEVVKYDKFFKYDKFEDLLACDFVFIMVPTPFDCQKNKVDDSAILENLARLDELNYSEPVIIKSTIPPGSCQIYASSFDLNIVFNPEFLRESTTPNEDFKNQDTVVIGTDSPKTFELVKNMYKQVTVKNAEFFHTSTKEAEMIKCAQNTMLASRVALANMIYDSCQVHGIDYQSLRKIAFDRFEVLGPYMVKVPGPDGKRGFGGKCLPKDIRAFSTIFDSDLLRAVIEYNDHLRDDLNNYLVNFIKKDNKGN